MLGFPFLFASYYQSISLQLRKEKLNRLFHFFAPRNKISVGIPLTDMSVDPFSCYFRDSPGSFLNSNSFLGYEQVSLRGSFHMSSLVFLVTFIPLLACTGLLR